MFGWSSQQRNVAIASFLSWTLDAFDFFILVFLLSDIAAAFHVGMEQVTLAILLTLAVRPIGALLFGRAAEKYGRRPILMVNILFFQSLSCFPPLRPLSPLSSYSECSMALRWVVSGGLHHLWLWKLFQTVHAV